MILAAILAMTVAGAALAGWQTSVETNMTATSWTWWQTDHGMVYVKAMSFHTDSVASNLATFYRLDASTNAFKIEATGTTATTNLQDWIVTPSGNGEIAVPENHGVRVSWTSNTLTRIILDLFKPE